MKKSKIQVGDIIFHGLLDQLWLIEKREGKLTARIISNDSGRGYREYISDLGFFLKGNNTQIIGNIKNYEKKS